MPFYFLDDETGDNPIMIAAKLRHKDLVSSVLRSNRFDGSDDIDFLGELIHSRNGSGQTLLAMVALQGKIHTYVSNLPSTCIRPKLLCFKLFYHQLVTKQTYTQE